MTNTKNPTANTDTDSNHPARNLSVCTPDDDVTVQIKKIAGSNTFGSADVEDPNSVYETLDELDPDAPIVVTGGGAIGAPKIRISRFSGVSKSDDTVRLTFEPKIVLKGDRVREATKDERSVQLGSWEVHLPVDNGSSGSLDSACDGYVTGETEFFLQSNRDTAADNAKTFQAFGSLEPGDTVSVKPYSTPLVVLSEQFDTHAKKPSTLNDRRKTVEVRAVTVSNPNGGAYQLGVSLPDVSTGNPDAQGIFAVSDRIQHCRDTPSFYLSSSQNTPPKPNAVFTTDSTFSPDSFSIVDRGTEDSTVIGPDQGLLDSPLPARALQKSMSEIDGIGEKTERKLFTDLDGIATAHTAAYSLFDDGEFNEHTIREILASVPRSADILDTLYAIYVNDINPEAPANRPEKRQTEDADQQADSNAQKSISDWS